MKEPSVAAAYACLYPGLCDIARAHGYALAIHGSMVTDLDLIAIPWTEIAADAETVVNALMAHAGAVTFRESCLAHGTPAKLVDEIVERAGGDPPKKKPHGRLAWSLHLDHGCYIDVSVMPKLTEAAG